MKERILPYALGAIEGVIEYSLIIGENTVLRTYDFFTKIKRGRNPSSDLEKDVEQPNL